MAIPLALVVTVSGVVAVAVPTFQVTLTPGIGWPDALVTSACATLTVLPSAGELLVVMVTATSFTGTAVKTAEALPDLPPALALTVTVSAVVSVRLTVAIPLALVVTVSGVVAVAVPTFQVTLTPGIGWPDALVTSACATLAVLPSAGELLVVMVTATAATVWLTKVEFTESVLFPALALSFIAPGVVEER